jgi:hypothetical protein
MARSMNQLLASYSAERLAVIADILKRTIEAGQRAAESSRPRTETAVGWLGPVREDLRRMRAFPSRERIAPALDFALAPDLYWKRRANGSADDH